MSNHPLTEEDFIRGRPDAILGATKKPKILLLWPHGDEELGPRLAYNIVTEHPELLSHIDYVCGNPLAANEGTRHTPDGTDLNRSYNRKAEPKNYEERRAAFILDLIQKNGYDYVLDLHTSYSDTDRFFIIDHRNPAVDTIIGASAIDRAVIMLPEISVTSLIGQVANSAVIEYARHYPHEKAIRECLILIMNLLNSKSSPPSRARSFYPITNTIPRDDEPEFGAKNFELCEKGYYPILYSQAEGSYRTDTSKSYVGFAAAEKQIVELPTR